MLLFVHFHYHNLGLFRFKSHYFILFSLALRAAAMFDRLFCFGKVPAPFVCCVCVSVNIFLGGVSKSFTKRYERGNSNLNKNKIRVEWIAFPLSSDVQLLLLLLLFRSFLQLSFSHLFLRFVLRAVVLRVSLLCLRLFCCCSFLFNALACCCLRTLDLFFIFVLFFFTSVLLFCSLDFVFVFPMRLKFCFK